MRMEPIQIEKQEEWLNQNFWGVSNKVHFFQENMYIMDYRIRPILEGEDSLLEDFLYEVVFVPEGMSAPPKSIINQPELQIYITDFGKKKDDIGLVAEVDKKAVGAV